MYKELVDELYKYVVAYKIADEYDGIIPSKEKQDLYFLDEDKMLIEKYSLFPFEGCSLYDIVSLLRNFIEVKYDEYHKEEV